MSKVLIVGGNGFLGSHIWESFGHFAFREIPKQYNFEINIDALAVVAEYKPEVMINASGRTAGILANRTRPADFFLSNLLSGLNLMEAARIHDVKKYVQIGTVCSYPKTGNYPMTEIQFWNNYPEETNGAYGIAKKLLVTQAQVYAKQYKFVAISPILANLYGPGDSYDPDKSHVIPGVIVQFMNAIEKGENFVTLWGSGKCTRDFLYVEDAADAIKLLTEKYNSPEIINVTSGRETSIRDLAESVATACGFKGDIRWDTAKPDGQKRRCFDTTKMDRLGWSARTSLKVGIAKSVEDYKAWKKANEKIPVTA